LNERFAHRSAHHYEELLHRFASSVMVEDSASKFLARNAVPLQNTK
jgi:hypothetical protein